MTNFFKGTPGDVELRSMGETKRSLEDYMLVKESFEVHYSNYHNPELSAYKRTTALGHMRILFRLYEKLQTRLQSDFEDLGHILPRKRTLTV